MSQEKRGLNLDILQRTIEEDMDIVDNRDLELNSIGDLDTVVTPIEQNKPITAPVTAQTQEETDIEELEEESQEDQTTVPQNQPKNKTKEQTQDILKVFGANLADRGLIDFKEEEYDKAEDKDLFFEEKVADRIKQEVEDGIKLKESEWPEEVTELVNLTKKGVPLYELLEADQRIASFEAIKPADIDSDVELQKDILLSLFTMQGYSEERANAKIKRAEDLATLKDDATDALDLLIDKEKKDKQEMIVKQQEVFAKKESERKQRLLDIETSIKSAKEIIPGMPLTEEDKRMLINGITKVSAVDKAGKPINALAKARLDDPNMDLKVAYFTLVLKGDLSKLQKKAETKATRKLQNIVESTNPMQSSMGGSTSQQERATGVNKSILKKSLSAMRKEK